MNEFVPLNSSKLTKWPRETKCSSYIIPQQLIIIKKKPFTPTEELTIHFRRIEPVIYPELETACSETSASWASSAFSPKLGAFGTSPSALNIC
jgi:hypothetical protein